MNVKNNYVHENIADIGGHKILGMSGSLTGYIRTGNPYDAQYYRKDEYINSNAQNKNKNNNSFLKTILQAATIAGGAVAGYKLFKSGKLSDIKKYFEKFKSGFKKLTTQKSNQKTNLDITVATNETKKAVGGLKTFLTNLKKCVENIHLKFKKD